MYIDDLLRCRKFNEINEMIKKGEITLKDLINLDDDSIETLAVNLHLLENVNIDDLVNVFTKASAYVIVLFASNAHCLTEAHIETLADSVIKTGNIDSMLEFATIPNAPTNKLGGKINELKNIEKIIDFLENVPNISNELMNDFARTIVATKDIEVIKRFLEAHQDIYDSTYGILVSKLIEMNNADNMISFIKRAKECHKIIPKERLKTLLNSIITLLKEVKTKSREFEDIYQYITENYPKEMQTEIFDNLTDKVILTQRTDLIANFGTNFKGANKFKIAIALVNSNSFKWIYIFAKNAKNIPDDAMNILIEFVRESKSPEFIYLFLCNLNLYIANIVTLVVAIKEVGDLNYIGYALLNVGNKYLEGNLKTPERMLEIMKLKEVLKGYLDEKNYDYNCLIYPITNPSEDLEKKLLESDDEIQDPFAPTANPKTMNLV